MTAIERLTLLSGEFQRIGLSATIKPFRTVADFIGGYSIQGGLKHPVYKKRDVLIVTSRIRKTYQINIQSIKKNEEITKQNSIWPSLVKEFKKKINQNNSTLFFTNNRKLCKNIIAMINSDEDDLIAYFHHGSLSKEIHQDVENKLKTGKLKAIISTSSLEIGIDIGSLDEVILIQSPPSVSSAIQRIGRAGHRVNQISRGTLFPSHSKDFIESAVLAKEIINNNIEEIRPVYCPLDVLAQIIMSMTGNEIWDIQKLYHVIISCYSYRNLNFDHFNLVRNMLGGRYKDTNIRELNPKLSIDKIDHTVGAKKSVLLSLYMSGGTIPDRGYYKLRHSKTNAIIGELDEEFVWETRIGQIFTLGSQDWRIH